MNFKGDKWWLRVCPRCEREVNVMSHEFVNSHGQHYHIVCWSLLLQEDVDREYPDDVEPQG